VIIFSDARAEDKIRFLFDLFDYNGIQSVSLMDLQFCIMCVLISTCKLWLIKENIKEVEVFDLIRQSFSEEDRITIAQILRWVAASDEVKSYFSILKMTGPMLFSSKQMNEAEYKFLE